MIPANLMKSLVGELIAKTRTKEVQWSREKFDREHYAFTAGVAKIALRFHPSRADADSIELLVMNQMDEVIGTLLGDEEKPAVFDILSTLLFEIQRIENRDNIKGITDEVLNLLSGDARKNWQG